MPLISLILAALLPAVAAASCGDPATPIHRIQSDGTRSPLAGQTVTVEGIVTRDAREPGGFNGFYLQQADHETDNNPATRSEEHTSELQSRPHLVCRLLLEKKNKPKTR